MRIISLNEHTKVYTSNVYYVLGEWNALGDTNTLIDAGKDPAIIDIIEKTYTGVGKKKIDQVILTHSHSDHIGILGTIIDLYNPVVYAMNRHIKGVNMLLYDGQKIKIGERPCEVIRVTVHSHDSICIYCEENKVLFSGDTNFPIRFENPQVENENEYAIRRLEKKLVKKVYPGHGKIQDFSENDFKVVKNKRR